MASPQLNVRIPQFLNDKLNTHVCSTGSSKTEIVVNALSCYLGYIEDIPLEKRITTIEERLGELEAVVSNVVYKTGNFAKITFLI